MALFKKWLPFSGDHDQPPKASPVASKSRSEPTGSERTAAMLLRAPTALMQLSETEAATVVGFMRPRQFAAGTTIIRQGEAADTGFMVLVLDGEITVEMLMASRVDPATVSVLGPGSLIGEMALIDGGARPASCIASSEVRCAVLTREALESLIAEQPATAAKLMTAVAQRLAERLRDSGHKLQIYSKLVQTMQQEIDTLMPTSDRHL